MPRGSPGEPQTFQDQVASEVTSSVTNKAMEMVTNACSTLGEYIKQGPDGVQWLGFMGGIATTLVNGLGLINFFDLIFNPCAYVVIIFQVLLGLGTCVIEAPDKFLYSDPRGPGMAPQSRGATQQQRTAALIAGAPPLGNPTQVKKVQVEILTNAKFLETPVGKGLFYIFQGCVSFVRSGMGIEAAVAGYMCFVGLVQLGVACGCVTCSGSKETTDAVYSHVR